LFGVVLVLGLGESEAGGGVVADQAFFEGGGEECSYGCDGVADAAGCESTCGELGGETFQVARLDCCEGVRPKKGIASRSRSAL
jgi:hypothetical protein